VVGDWMLETKSSDAKDGVVGTGRFSFVLYVFLLLDGS
jgi:hypothetical protein